MVFDARTSAWRMTKPTRNSHADCNCKRDKRAMLDFLGKAAQGIVAKLCRLAANFRRFVAHGIGAPANLVRHAAQRGSNSLADVVGGLHGTRRGSDTNTFQTLFHRSQAPFDFTDIGGRAGISGLTKHHEAPSELRRITIDRECSWHSHAVLA
jgi:hypothetical protein